MKGWLIEKKRVRSITEVKSFRPTGLQNKDEHDNKTEEAVRYDQVYGVIQVSSSQVKCKGRS